MVQFFQIIMLNLIDCHSFFVGCVSQYSFFHSQVLVLYFFIKDAYNYNFF